MSDSENKAKVTVKPIDPANDPLFVKVARFALINRVSEDTIYRNRKSYPKIRKLGGRNVMMITEIERWGGLREE